MSIYLLDTNTVSYLVQDHPAVIRRATSLPTAAIRISAITEGELVFGLEKRRVSKHLYRSVTELLRRIDVLPWGRAAAKQYGALRATLERGGKGLGDIDLLIAAHALSVGGILVTSDRAFRNVPGLDIEDWAKA